jgi:hypothetical protein
MQGACCLDAPACLPTSLGPLSFLFLPQVWRCMRLPHRHTDPLAGDARVKSVNTPCGALGFIHPLMHFRCCLRC